MRRSVTCRDCGYVTPIVVFKNAWGDAVQTHRCGKCSAPLGISVIPASMEGGGE